MTRCCGAAANRSQRGIALLMTLVAMSLLTLLVIEFTYDAQVDYRRTAHWLKARRAALLAESGIELASEILRLDARMSTVDALSELWAAPLPPIQSEDGTIFLRISDENARFNLNLLGSGVHSTNGRRFMEILAQLEFEPELAAALADWLDRNNAVSSDPVGAERDYYQSIGVPYPPRNSALRSFAELALIRGFDTHRLSALRPLCTVLPETQDKINPNTAPAAVLEALDPALRDGVLVGTLLAYREQTPIRNSQMLLELEGWKTAFRSKSKLDKMFRYSSSYFRVLSSGEVDGVFQSVEAVLYRDLDEIHVVYFLPRRGPNIADIDDSAPARFADLGPRLFGSGGKPAP